MNEGIKELGGSKRKLKGEPDEEEGDEKRTRMRTGDGGGGKQSAGAEAPEPTLKEDVGSRGTCGGDSKKG